MLFRSNTSDDLDEGKLISVPNVQNQTLSEARKNLQALGFNVIIANEGVDANTTLVIDQVPKAGVALREDSVVCLYSSETDTRKKEIVPDVTGMTAAGAINS